MVVVVGWKGSRKGLKGVTESLKALRRFKDDVREVQQGYECGMSLENYDDIKDGDVIECFEAEEVARTL